MTDDEIKKALDLAAKGTTVSRLTGVALANDLLEARALLQELYFCFDLEDVKAIRPGSNTEKLIGRVDKFLGIPT